jgi:hypothetical protein
MDKPSTRIAMAGIPLERAYGTVAQHGGLAPREHMRFVADAVLSGGPTGVAA